MLANGLLILSYSFPLSHDAMCALQLTPSTINKEDLNTVVESAKEKVFDTSRNFFNSFDSFDSL